MGEIIGGRYELLTELTTGPFGTVHQARHVSLDTPVRVTLLASALTDRPEVVSAFRVRASAAVGLEHRCAVRVIEFGADGDPRYLAEDLVAGPTAAERLASGGPLRPGQALVIVAQLARMLVQAHERGVIHGNVCAGAVVLERDDLARPRLGDFALDPRWLQPLPDELRSSLAPEAVPTARTDVFGLGRLLAVLCGDSLPALLRDCVARATSPEPSARHADVRAFLAELAAVGRGFGPEAAVALGPGDATATAPRMPPPPSGDDSATLISRLRAAPSVPLQPPAGARSWRVLGLPGAFNFPWWIVLVGAFVGVVSATRSWYLRPAPRPPAPVAQPPALVARPPAPVARPMTSTTLGILAWGRALPASAEAAVVAGERLEFSAEAAGGAGPTITYRWFVDGREAGAGQTFTYTPDAESAAATAEVKVTAASPPVTLERRWKVQVSARSQPPVLAAASPDVDSITLTSGSEQRFEVTVGEPHAETLTYTWEEDGTVRASGPEPSWTLRAGRPGQTDVRVTVADAAGASAPPRLWSVTVMRNLPPRITGLRPPTGSVLEVAAGDDLQMGVHAVDPNAGDRLAYRWLLDGREVARSRSWRWATPPEPGTHRVEVEVADAAGMRSPHTVWVVEVTPRMREVDVREWLDRLRAAFERKDVATLRLYGVVATDEQAAAVRRALRRYDEYRVAMRNPEIQVNGRYATVSVERADSDGGKPVGTTRETYQLEKHTNGLITLRGAVRP